MWTIKQDGQFLEHAQESSVDKVIERVRALVRMQKDGSFTVYKEGVLVAVETNRKIEGVFVQQRWGGRKGDDAIFVDRVEFDATDAVLSMEHADLIELEDGADSSDDIGRQSVQWAGPFEVQVVEAVCEYFGVESVRDITWEVLAYARAQVPKLETETVEVCFKLKLKRLGGVPKEAVEAFLAQLECSSGADVGVVLVSQERKRVY